MLNGLFNSNYRVFREVPFDEFRVYFDHQGYVAINARDDELELSFADVTGAYTADLSDDVDRDPLWLVQIKHIINVELIRTQRLQTEVAIEVNLADVDTPARARSFALAVEEASAKSASLVHDVNRQIKLSRSQLNEIQEIVDIVEKLLRTKQEDNSHENTVIREQLDHAQSMMESIAERETAFLDKHGRLMMLVNMLNRHFSFKRVFSDAESGLIIVSHDGELIPVSRLSSGEQHQLVLFSKLLFDVPPNSLVLIDEPELSLHVTWQHDFLNDLKRVIDLCDFDVLIATHSPQIVHDRWDWMVDLHNPEADLSEDVAEYA